MKDAADKVTDSDKTAVEDAIKALELAVKEDNLDDIKSKLEALDNAFLPVSQKSMLTQALLQKRVMHNHNKPSKMMGLSMQNSPK